MRPQGPRLRGTVDRGTRGLRLTQLAGVDAERALETICQFNAAVRIDVPFDPSTEDGRSAAGLAVPKSNWSTTIDTPPFEAYAVTCGITFTYGGRHINRGRPC